MPAVLLNKNCPQFSAPLLFLASFFGFLFNDEKTSLSQTKAIDFQTNFILPSYAPWQKKSEWSEEIYFFLPRGTN
jgi:hypothetical protein